MQTIAIANHKGGSGKTTTAVNLAACLAEMQYQILLIDLDPQSHASLSFGIEIEKTERSVFWAMGQPASDRALLAEIAMPVAKGLSLVPSAPLSIAAEEELMKRPNRLLRLRELITQVPKYDFVLIDCPPALGILTCNAFMASEVALLPVETSFYAMNGVGRALEILNELEAEFGHKVHHMAVATLFDRRTALARDILEELRRFFRGALLETVIRQSIHLREAASRGQPVTAYAPSSKGCRDYCDLTEEFLQRLESSEQPDVNASTEEIILLGQMYGGSRETIDRMREAGYTTLDAIRRADAKKLASHTGLSQHVARQLIRHAVRLQGFPTRSAAGMLEVPTAPTPAVHSVAARAASTASTTHHNDPSDDFDMGDESEEITEVQPVQEVGSIVASAITALTANELLHNEMMEGGTVAGEIFSPVVVGPTGVVTPIRPIPAPTAALPDYPVPYASYAELLRNESPEISTATTPEAGGTAAMQDEPS